MKKITNYLRDVWVELRKITWPTPMQSLNLALLVLVLTLIVATYTGLLDFGFGSLVKSVIVRY